MKIFMYFPFYYNRLLSTWMPQFSILQANLFIDCWSFLNFLCEDEKLWVPNIKQIILWKINLSSSTPLKKKLNDFASLMKIIAFLKTWKSEPSFTTKIYATVKINCNFCTIFCVSFQIIILKNFTRINLPKSPFSVNKLFPLRDWIAFIGSSFHEKERNWIRQKDFDSVRAYGNKKDLNLSSLWKVRWRKERTTRAFLSDALLAIKIAMRFQF